MSPLHKKINTPTASVPNKKFIVRTYAQDLAIAKQKIITPQATHPTKDTKATTIHTKPLSIPLPPQNKVPLTPLSIQSLPKLPTTKTPTASTKTALPTKTPIQLDPLNQKPLITPRPPILPVSTTLEKPIPAEQTKSQSRIEVLERLQKKSTAPEIPTDLVVTHRERGGNNRSLLTGIFAWLTGKSGEPTQTHIYEDVIPARDRKASPPIAPPRKTPQIIPIQQQSSTEPTVKQSITIPLPPTPPTQIPLPKQAQVSTKPIQIVEMEKAKPSITTAPPPKPVQKEHTTQSIQKNTQHMATSPLHTYRMDVADTIKETGASRISILASQHDAKPVSEVSTIKEKRILLWFAIGGIFLFILSIAGTGYAYLYHARKIAPAPVIQRIPSLVPANSTQELTGTGTSLLNAFAQVAHTPLQNGLIKTVYIATTTKENNGSLEKHPLPGGYLIAALHLPMPTILMNNTAVDSTAGVVGANNQTYPFFILRVASYDSAFAGMLRWEGSLASDMQILYPQPIINTVATTSVATNTQMATSTNTVLHTIKLKLTTMTQTSSIPAGFIDKTIANHAVRVLQNAYGQSIMLYGFANKHTLIIARNGASFVILLTKLNQ